METLPARERLWIVMPAYNEEAAVEAVVGEWLPALRRAGADLTFLAIDDGSRDGTRAALERAAAAGPEVRVVTQANAGHGAACLAGYRLALASGAEWVLQIDSDGQCDPRFFADLWERRAGRAAVFGYRARREDGRLRWLISRAVSLAVLVGAGAWVADPNVPFRLMRRDALSAALEEFPADFQLANVLLAVRLERRDGIHWVPITFRRRLGGSPSVRWWEFARQGARLVRALRREAGR
jgi:glycosyltransferase involved in cell wall biosynthesis